jgi:glycosyltransferase involved in cell wall biosynthesis
VERLRSMPHFRFDRLELTRRRNPLELGGGLVRLIGAARKHDLIHVHGDAAALACLPAIGIRPTVITLHGSHLLRRSRGMRGRLVRAGVRRALGRAAAVIAVSESELAFARVVAPSAADRMVLIHNGVPVADPLPEAERLAARERLGVDEGSVLALFVGELSERKQPLQFAEAVAKARRGDPRLVGVLAGDGPLRGTLEARAADWLLVLGRRDDVDELMAAADLFVLPSLWEGLPYVVLEAMARGRAILVSDGPGNLDAVGDAGISFSAGDVDAMSEGMLRLAREPELRRSLGEVAASRARERFSIAGMKAATAAVYERALGYERAPGSDEEEPPA